MSEPEQYTHWASQGQTIRTMAQHDYPDVILREDEVDIYLPVLVIQTRYQGEDNPQATVEDTPFNLSGIYNEETEALTRDAYPLGFARFGFGSYR